MSLLVATVNAMNIPFCCRAFALASDARVETVTVYLPMATSHDMIQNIASTRRMAITASHTIDHCTIHNTLRQPPEVELSLRTPAAAGAG